jgi:hypothetical protein
MPCNYGSLKTAVYRFFKTMTVVEEDGKSSESEDEKKEDTDEEKQDTPDSTP